MGVMKGKITSVYSQQNVKQCRHLDNGQELTLKKAHSLFQRWKLEIGPNYEEYGECLT